MLRLPSLDKNPKALVLDLDGTLFNSRLEISSRNRQALESCLDKGIPVIIATGRAERSVIRRFDPDLLARCSLVSLNGALARGVHPLSGTVHNPIPPYLAAEVVRWVSELEPNAQLTVEIKGFEFGMNRRPDAAVLWAVNSATPDMLLTLDQAIKMVPHTIAVGGLGRELSGLMKDLTRFFNDSISIIPSSDCTFLNIVKSGVSKTKALAVLLSSRNISFLDVMAFGDDIPDMDMLFADIQWPCLMPPRK